MKKITLFFAVMTAAFSIFAQSSKYIQLLNTAKEFEKNENWIYALGYYADAIAEDPAFSEEAFAGFANLHDNIESGNPGNIQYTEEELYEHWKTLLIEAEAYWTEFCPYTINIGPVELKSANNISSDYWADICIRYSEKYQLIMNAVEEGYRKSYDYSWDLPVPVREYSNDGYRYCGTDDYWPRVSVTKGNAAKNGYNYSLTTDPQDFYKNNVATIGFSSSSKNDYEPLFEKGKNLKIYTDKAIGEFYNAFAYHEALDTYCLTLYEARIGFMTKDGTVLKESAPYILIHQLDTDETGFKIEIEKIRAENAEPFEKGEVIPFIDDIFLHIGFQSCEMYNKPDGEFYFTENEIFALPKLRYESLENMQIYYSDMRQKDRFGAFVFANLYRDDLKEGISEGLEQESTDEGYMQYLSDLRYSDDFIEMTYDRFNNDKPFRIPLWVFAQICSKESNLPVSYDNFGNQISDKGFIVGLDPTNQYYTFKHLLELTPQQKAALLSKAMKKADRQMKKIHPVYELEAYYSENDSLLHAEYFEIISLYEELSEAINNSNASEISKLSDLIEEKYPYTKYKEAEKALNDLKKQAEETDELYDATLLRYMRYSEALENSSHCQKELETIRNFLDYYGNNSSTFSLNEKIELKDSFNSLPFEPIDSWISYISKQLSENDELFSSISEKFDSLNTKINTLLKPRCSEEEIEELYNNKDYVFCANSLERITHVVSEGIYDELDEAIEDLKQIDLSDIEKTVDERITEIFSKLKYE